VEVVAVLERSAYGRLYLKQYSNDTKKRKKKKKCTKTASSVSSTHPAIEISTPPDYHDISVLHPPP